MLLLPLAKATFQGGATYLPTRSRIQKFFNPRFLSLLQMDSNTPLPAQILHGLITVLLVAITHKLGIILRLFVFVSIGFDLLVIASLFVFRFR